MSFDKWVDAKSPLRSLSSFLPSDVKSVGFADKVLANAGPEGPMASDGKESLGPNGAPKVAASPRNHGFNHQK